MRQRLLSCLLRIDEGACSSLEYSEFLATNLSLSSGSKLKSFIGTSSISELHKAKFVVSRLVGVFFSVPDPEVKDDSALMLNFEEFLETSKID